MPLSKKTFLEVVKSTPLVSMDLLVWDTDSRLLLGQRVNRPAQGYWFVPGGRIYKDERLADAFARITFAELCVEIPFAHAEFYGVYEHFYSDNFYGMEGISTHYVVLAYQLHLVADGLNLPLTQHQNYCWMAVTELLQAGDVHPNTKGYFSPPG